MKKADLRKLILEVKEELQVQEELKSTKDYEIKDDIGKFFIVTTPKTNKATKDDILIELDVFGFANQIKGGLTFEEVKGIFKNKSEAGKLATEIILNNEKALKEIESEMKEFRTTKSELDAKRQALKDKASKLKPKEQ